jgi:ElaB/YqjD/DUF883 family membrane-anchored ribosome-binding protein
MIADANHNGPVSGTTSMRYEKISAAKTEKPNIDSAHLETEMSEEALLRHHADSAMKAMRELLSKIHGDMSHVADPREWAERYPWATVAAAAAAGFVAAKVIKPRKKPEAPATPHAAAESSADAGVAAPAAFERARYEAYLRDQAQAKADGASAAPHESMWSPLVEMAKSAAARYIMSAAQAGIAAFAAAHAAKSAGEEDRSRGDDHEATDAPSDMDDSSSETPSI